MTDLSVTWTDERVELLKKLWGEGLSASQIATEIGGVSRNAVIGKVHRLGLSGRGKTPPQSTPRPRAKPVVAAAPAPIRPVASTPPAPANGAADLTAVEIEMTDPEPAILAPRAPPQGEAVIVPLSERVTIMELRESMCRWPMGDPTSPEFRFCGARSLTGLPYCDHHAQIAYQPASDRKRDRRLLRA